MLIFKKVPVMLFVWLAIRGRARPAQQGMHCGNLLHGHQVCHDNCGTDYFNNWQVVFLGSPVCRGIADNLKGAWELVNTELQSGSTRLRHRRLPSEHGLQTELATCVYAR